MGENAAAVRADLAQELRDALDQATLCAQHLPVDVGDLSFPDRYRNNPLGVVVDRAYIDVDSWIDFHVLEVLSGNVDALHFSTFFYKPRAGKITWCDRRDRRY